MNGTLRNNDDVEGPRNLDPNVLAGKLFYLALVLRDCTNRAFSASYQY